MKVFISTTTFAQDFRRPLALLKKARIGYVLNPYQRKMAKGEIKQVLKNDNYAGLIAGTEPLTAEVLNAALGLKVISRVGAGLDNIDLRAAKELGIKVFNTPDALTDAVAELTIALILNALRKINLCDRNMRQGIWKKEMGALFKGKTLGIIGMGRIGSRVSEIARCLGAKIIFFDILKIKTGIAHPVSLRKLLRASDIITIHASGNRRIISKKEIDYMKDSSILIAVARGGLVDEEALYQGLISKKIAYAALDTFAHEPYQGRLIKLDNVILTPHIGSYALEARIIMELEAVKNLIRGLKGTN